MAWRFSIQTPKGSRINGISCGIQDFDEALEYLENLYGPDFTIVSQDFTAEGEPKKGWF